MALIQINLTDHFREWFDKTNNVATSLGDLSLLDTTAKDNFVNAINEIAATSGAFPEWDNIQNKPATFAPSAHTHIIADVTGLQTELNDLDAADTNLQSQIDSHTHVIADVTDLSTELAKYKERIRSISDAGTYVVANDDGSVEIYSQSSLVFSITSNSSTITPTLNVANAVSGTHALNRNTADGRYLRFTGGTLTGNLSIPNASAGTHALNRNTADGRYIQLGQYGIGGSTVSEATNLNNLDLSGLYVSSVTTTANSPDSNSRFIVVHNKIDATNSVQLAIELATGATIRAFMRAKVASSWGSWSALFSQSNVNLYQSLGSNWVLQPNGNFNASKFSRYFFYPQASAITITLPGSPSIGDWVELHAVGVAEADNQWIVGRNGSNIMGVTEDLTVDVPNRHLKLVYCDATVGWVIQN